jgi:hypothetical protein
VTWWQHLQLWTNWQKRYRNMDVRYIWTTTFRRLTYLTIRQRRWSTVVRQSGLTECNARELCLPSASCWLIDFLTLKKEAVRSTETSEDLYWYTQHYNPEKYYSSYDLLSTYNLLVSCLIYTSNLKMEAVCSSETSAYLYRIHGYIVENSSVRRLQSKTLGFYE